MSVLKWTLVGPGLRPELIRFTQFDLKYSQIKKFDLGIEIATKQIEPNGFHP